MYSAAKYPANHVYKEYRVTIPQQCKRAATIPSVYKCSVPIRDIPEAYLASNCKTEDGQYAASINLQEKLQFYHVRSKTSKKADNSEDDEEPFPPQLSSVSALLLFDSMDSPYEKTVRSSRQSNDKQQIEDAPDSIVQPWLSSEMDSSSSYLYTPTLGEVRIFSYNASIYISMYHFINYKSESISLIIFLNLCKSRNYHKFINFIHKRVLDVCFRSLK